MRYVPVSSNSAPVFGGPDILFHLGYWQGYFLKEIHDTINLAPYAPTITSPTGGENVSSRYFTVTWLEASPITDPNVPEGDSVVYKMEYSIDGGFSWLQAIDNNGDPIIDLPEGNTSAIWDLGAIPDTTIARVRICPFDVFEGLPGPCSVSGFFTISGGTCF